MKKYKVSYSINKTLCNIDVVAENEAAALREANNKLKKIGAPFLLYGATERS